MDISNFYISYNLDEFNFSSVLFRLILALIIGVIIGIDRSRKGSPAGLKTHSIVCIGSTLIMLTSEYCVLKYGLGDLTRMPAQVISGIGFLGAGTILVTRGSRIKGLTSAAGIWFSACVGLSIGCGFYVGAVISTIFEVFAINALSKGSSRIMNSLIEVYLEYDQNFALTDMIKAVKSNNAKIIAIDTKSLSQYDFEESGLKNSIITIELNKQDIDVESFLESLEHINGIIDITQI